MANTIKKTQAKQTKESTASACSCCHSTPCKCDKKTSKKAPVYEMDDAGLCQSIVD